MQRIMEAPSYPPSINKMTAGQIANQATWQGGWADDGDPGAATMYQVTQFSKGASTETRVNPLDPAQFPGTTGWNDPAVSWDRVPANSWRKY